MKNQCVVVPSSSRLSVRLLTYDSKHAERLQIVSERDGRAARKNKIGHGRMSVGGGRIYRGRAGVGGTQDCFEISEAERAEAVAEGNGARKPRWAVLTNAHFHKAQIERDGGRGDVAKRDGGECVAVPDATGEESFLAVWDRANGETDFPVVCCNEISNEGALGSIGRPGKQPCEGGGEFVAEAGARSVVMAKRKWVFRFCVKPGWIFRLIRPEAEHRLETLMRFADIVPLRSDVECGGILTIESEHGGDGLHLSDD